VLGGYTGRYDRARHGNDSNREAVICWCK
jgi:hypothetical protein